MYDMQCETVDGQTSCNNWSASNDPTVGLSIQNLRNKSAQMRCSTI